jgi:hypothetical protein
MKVYIVTSGSYSDYIIEKIFSNKAAAEEYKKWHNIRNDIEEYEVYDEPFEKTDGDKVMFIEVRGTVYPEAMVDIRYTIRPEMVRADCTTGCTGCNGRTDYHKRVYTIYTYHYITADQWDEEKYKAKYTKALYDLAGITKAMFAEGATVRDVEQALRDKEID